MELTQHESKTKILAMQSYLAHLLADIEAAHRIESPEENTKSESIEEHFRDIERWVSGDAKQTLSYHCGLKTEAFPPHDQLRDDDVGKICNAFMAMLNSWRFDLDLPDELPLHRKYELLVGLLDHECTLVNTGRFVFDFCTGYAPGCKLREYCPCLDIWEED